jgi:hypothetical protein
MSRSQFPKLLQEGLNTVFGLEYRDYPNQWKAIFKIETSDKSSEEDTLVSGFDLAPVKAEGAGVAYDAGAGVWTASYVHETVALAFSVTEEAEEDNLYMKQGAKYSKALARSMQHRKEVTGANILNNAFSSSFLGGDGLELCSTAHPMANGSTFANELSTAADLSETSLEQALVDISNFTDDKGLNIMAKAKKLIIPTELQFIAERVLNSTKQSGTANNDPNAIKNMGLISEGYAVNNYLTDTDAFFITTDCPDGLKHFRRVGVKRGVEGDFESGNLRYKARERYSFGWTDPRGIFGSPGA